MDSARGMIVPRDDAKLDWKDFPMSTEELPKRLSRTLAIPRLEEIDGDGEPDGPEGPEGPEGPGDPAAGGGGGGLGTVQAPPSRGHFSFWAISGSVTPRSVIIGPSDGG